MSTRVSPGTRRALIEAEERSATDSEERDDDDDDDSYATHEGGLSSLEPGRRSRDHEGLARSTQAGVGYPRMAWAPLVNEVHETPTGVMIGADAGRVKIGPVMHDGAFFVRS